MTLIQQFIIQPGIPALPKQLGGFQLTFTISMITMGLLPHCIFFLGQYPAVYRYIMLDSKACGQ
jgi:hypothetical protein